MLLNYRTKDLYLAAYLIAKGINLYAVNTQPSTQIKWFIFDDIPACKKAENDFWNYKGKMVVKKYADAIRLAKERLYSGV